MKKYMLSLGIVGLFLPPLLSVNADNNIGETINGNESDTANLHFDVIPGELGIAFKGNVDLEKGEVSKPSKVGSNFGTVDLGNVGNIAELESYLPSMYIANFTGRDIILYVSGEVSPFKSSKGKELKNAELFFNFENVEIAKEGEPFYGYPWNPPSDYNPIGNSKTTLYTSYPSYYTKGLFHTTNPTEQRLRLLLDTTELEANETYTSTFTISLAPNMMPS